MEPGDGGPGGPPVNAPPAAKRPGSGVQFNDTPSVGVAASSAPLRFSRLIKDAFSSAAAAPTPTPASGGADAAAAAAGRMPAPGARFDSSAVPARPALKANGSAGNLADAFAAAAAAPAGGPLGNPAPWVPLQARAPHGDDQGRDQQQQQQAAAAAGALAPKSAAGALFLSALGGGPAAPPPPPPSPGGADADAVVDDVGALRTRYGLPAGAGAAGAALAKAEPEVQPADVALEMDQAGAAAASAAPHAPASAAGSGGGASALARGRVSGMSGGGGGGGGGGDDGASVAASSVIIPPGSSQPLPPLLRQLTPRALAAGAGVGCGFALLATRLVLVAGLVPSFQVAAAFACWALLRGYTWILGRDLGCISPLAAQEVAVASAAALATAGSVAAGGFGPVFSALSQGAFDAAGNSAPANRREDVLSMSYAQGVVWLLLVGAAGGLMVVPFRRSLLAQASMVFPTGAATGHLINTLHTPAMSYHGRKQMSRFVQWSGISLAVSGYQWVFNNPACDGFAKFPTFGLTLAKWRWLFDFQMPLVGVGMMVPLGVAWSMVVGAVVSWGVLWPVLDAKQGDWFPSGLPDWDARGLFGYQLVLAMGLILADGLVTITGGCVSGGLALTAGRRPRGSGGGGRGGAPPSAAGKGAAGGAGAARPRGAGKGKGGGGKRRWQAEALAAMEADAFSDASSLQFSLAALERGLRRHVFMSDAMRGWGVACVVAAALLLVSASFAAPALFGLKGLRWWHLLVASVAAPFAALAAARGAGATDVSLAPALAAAGAAAFAAWGGPDGGVAAGLVSSGVLLAIAQSAVEMGFSFAAGYTVLASPTAIFIAHVVGCVAGALFAPFAFSLLAPPLPPSPLAGPARGAAVLFAQGGAGALPAYAGWMALAALVVGLLLAGVRAAVSGRARVMIPMPVVMAVIFLAGANVAVGVVFGAALRVTWRWRHPRSADAYAAIVGGALIAGDGVWAVGRALLGALGVAAPICMNFSSPPVA